MHSRKMGLFLAKRFRTCPPPELMGDPAFSEQIKEHRRICPVCAMRGADEDDAVWTALKETLEKVLGTPAVCWEPPIPGELRLAADEGCWRNGLYYTPPLVLVLEVNGSIADEVLVAQCYFDSTVAGPGDLILPHGAAPFEHIFIEPWNTYTLIGRHIGPALARVESSIVQAVEALDTDPQAYPEWAPRPRPMEPEDVRVYFRELEVETAYTFARREAEEIAAQVEGRGHPIDEMSPGHVREAMERKVPGVMWTREPETPRQTVALARLPADLLPLAAADSVPRQLPVTVVTVSDGDLVEVEATLCTFALESRADGALEVSGRIHKPAGAKGRAQLFSYYEARDGSVIEPEEWDWDEGTGDFFLRFPVEDLRDGRLALALVYTPLEWRHG